MGTLGTGVRTPAYGEPERDERFFRYSVKCDRTFAMRLEAAAAKAGVSVTSYVQAHFETILQPRPKATLQAFDPERFDAIGFAKRTNVTITAARIWAALRARADAAGEVFMSQSEIEQATGAPVSAVVKRLGELKEAGLVEQLSGAGTRGTKYRVMGE